MRGWLQAGVDVSEVRTGRKPGTRVMTVRSGTCGVPTLLVQPSAGKPSRDLPSLRARAKQSTAVRVDRRIASDCSLRSQ